MLRRFIGLILPTASYYKHTPKPTPRKYWLKMLDYIGYLLLYPILLPFKNKKVISNPKRILVVTLDALGDLLLSTPAIHALRDAYPNSRLDIVVDPSFDLFENNPFNYFWQFILYCPEASVRSPIGFTKYMSCFVFKKGSPRLVKWKTDIFRDTPGKMVEPDEGFINHPTPKPKHFIKEIMQMATNENDVILDPLIGSGSTAVACKQLNRRFIGFEIRKDYCSLANKRLEKIKSI